MATMMKKAPKNKGTDKKKSGMPPTIAKQGEYNGKATFEIHDEGRLDAGEDYTLVVSFGVRKAKAILRHLDELKEFVEANS